MLNVPRVSRALPALAAALAALGAPPPAHAEGPWAAERRAQTPGLYEVVVSLRVPRSGPAERVWIAVERARPRAVTLRPDPRRSRVRIRVRTLVRDGSVTVRVTGADPRPSVRAFSPRVHTAMRESRPLRPRGPAPAPQRPPAAERPPAPEPPATDPRPADPPPVTEPAADPPPVTETPARPPTPLPDRLVWEDEFVGPAGTAPDARRWNLIEGGHGWGNGELQAFTKRPQNVSLDGAGNLALTALKETYTGRDGYRRDYTSARLDTKGKAAFTYGRLEARIRVPAGRGLWSAFWTMGEDVWTTGWPNCGEMDVMEVIGSAPAVAHGTLHGPIGYTETAWATGRSVTAPASLADDFHVYGINWGPNWVEWSLDGRVYSRLTPSELPPGARWAFDHDFHVLLSLSVGGSWPGAPDASTPFPSRMLVDWVRVYQ